MQISEEPVWLRQFLNSNGILTESIFYKDPAFPQPSNKTSLLKICFRYHVTDHSFPIRAFSANIEAYTETCLILYSYGYQCVVREYFLLQATPPTQKKRNLCEIILIF